MSKNTRAEEVTARRRRRESMGADRNLKLHVPEDAKDPNYEHRWIYSRPGRVQQMTVMDDWDIVSSSDIASGSAGTTVERTADKRDGEKLILVRKPKKLVKEDRAQAAKAIDATEDAMRRQAPASPEGLAGPTAYVPGGKNIVNGR